MKQWRQIGRWCLLTTVGILLAACSSTAEPETEEVAQQPAAAPTAAISEEPASEEADNADEEMAEESESAAVEVTAVPTEIPQPEPTATSWLIEQLPSQGVAPEITNEVWINSEPLTLADLEGQVVLIEFWTFG